MIGADHLQLFTKYKNAPAHAFSNDFVTDDDKRLYWQLYRSLVIAAENVAGDNSEFSTFTSRLSERGGVQGQRPKDLWASVINEGSEFFGKYPQVFAIANERGIEIGFSLAIHERDYFNEEVKLRARSMLPSLYRRLPDPDGPIVSSIDASIATQDYKIVIRHRDGSEKEFISVSDLIRFHKSKEAGFRGGGTVYRLFDAGVVSAPEFDIEETLRNTLKLFAPLMKVLSPHSHDVEFVQNQYQIDLAISKVEEFDPEDDETGKNYTMRKLAQRLGQQSFRAALIVAYDGACAISQSSELNSLQAAHITPYNGKKTNHVTNGILLRADIHNLFDLGLIYIHPETRIVYVSPFVTCATYRKYDGMVAKFPTRASLRPSVNNLQTQADKYKAMHEDAHNRP